jgi:hypothetical protein
MSLIPPPEDRLPLAYFLSVLLAFYLPVSYFLEPAPRAIYWAWVVAGTAFLVECGVEPGLPRTLWGNVRRVLRAHVWPLYVSR